MPSLVKAGRIDGIFLMSQLNGVSSLSTTTSPLRLLTVTGTISAAKAPDSTARRARVTDSVAKASCISRVNPYFAEVASAKQPIALPSNGLCRPS